MKLLDDINNGGSDKIVMARYNPMYKKQPPKYNRPPIPPPPPPPSENQDDEMKEPPKPMETNEEMKGS